MAPSLLWTDDLARLAQGSGSPAPARARFPAGGVGVVPARPRAPAPAMPPRPHLTPTRVALPGTPEFAAAQLLARPPAAAPALAPAVAQVARPPAAPVQSAPTPAQVVRPPTAVAQPAPAAARTPAQVARPPARAASAPVAPAPPPAPPAVAPVPPAPAKPRSLSELAAVPARLGAELGGGQRPGVAPVTTSSAAWQRPTFKSVELRIESLDLEMAALAQQGAPAPALTPAVAAPAPVPASRPAIPPPPPAAARPPVSAPPPAPAPARIAEEAPPVPDESLPEHPSQAALAPGLIEAQLAAFLEWVVGATGAAAAFVADPDGLEMANHLATPELLAVSALMGTHAAELRRVLKAESEGALAFELDTENVLQVAWVDTELGRLALGLVVQQAPAAVTLAGLRERLREAARRPTSRRAQATFAPVNDSVF